jgi:MFS family permease
MTFKKTMAFVAMAFLWTGSQIPAYLYGGVPPYIYGDIGGVDRWTWFILGYLFALGAVCPFVGSLSDLFGRRYVALFGTLCLIVGNIVTATAHSMNVFIGGMCINGVGAGLNELTALAVTSELAPTRKRGLYVAILVFTILPFCPSVLWGQLISSRGSWRWIGLFCGGWAFIGFVLTLIFYFPPPRPNTAHLSRKESIRRVDFIGGFLSVAGLLLFTMGVQWGGYQYAWGSAHVVATLVLGIILFIAFCVYEWKFARYPMFPREMGKETRNLLLTLWITFVSGMYPPKDLMIMANGKIGMNFFSILLFWPTQSYNVYGHDPLEVGIRNLALGFPILAGACIVLCLLSYTRGRIRELMFVSCIFMTAGSGGMAALNRNNVWLSYLMLVISGLGIGGVVVPASIITNIICPDHLIATIIALTLSIRVLGGAVGYAIYYNVFLEHFKTNVTYYVGGAMVQMGITDKAAITEVIQLTGAGLINIIRELPFVTSDEMWEELVLAGQIAYAKSYPYVYYVSIAFGGITLVACAFLKNIDQYMTDHVAVNYDHESASSLERVHKPVADVPAVHNGNGHTNGASKEVVA